MEKVEARITDVDPAPHVLMPSLPQVVPQAFVSMIFTGIDVCGCAINIAVSTGAEEGSAWGDGVAGCDTHLIKLHTGQCNGCPRIY